MGLMLSEEQNRARELRKEGNYRIESLNQNLNVTPDSSNYRVAGNTGFKYAKEIPDDFFTKGLLRGELSGRPGTPELAYFAHGNTFPAYAKSNSHPEILKRVGHWGPEEEMPRNYVIEASKKFKDRLPKNKLYIGSPESFQFPIDGYPHHGLHRTLQPNPNPSLGDVINPMNRTGLKITQFDNGEIRPIKDANRKITGFSSSMPTNEQVLYDRVTPFSERPLSTHAKNLAGEARIAANALNLPAIADKAKTIGKGAGAFVAQAIPYVAADIALDSTLTAIQGREGTPAAWMTMPGTNNHSENAKRNLEEYGYSPNNELLKSIQQNASREFDDTQGRGIPQQFAAGVGGFVLQNTLAPGSGAVQTVAGTTGLAKGIEMYHAGVENAVNSYDIPGLDWYDRHALGIGRKKGMTRKQDYDKNVSDTLMYGMEGHNRMVDTYGQRYGKKLASLLKPDIDGYSSGGSYPSNQNPNILKDPINYKKINEFNNLDDSEVKNWASKPENKKWIYGQKMQDWGTYNAIPFLHKLHGGDESAAYNHYVSKEPELEDQLSIK